MSPSRPVPSDSPLSNRLLALLRIYLGVVFLVAVIPKITGEVPFADRLTGFLRNFALDDAHGFYRSFLASIVLPNVRLFAGLVVAGEVVAALGLVSGTATRLAGAVAGLLTLNYLLAKGAWLWTPSSNDAAFLMIAIVVAWGSAGRTLGVDGWLAERYPSWRLG